MLLVRDGVYPMAFTMQPPFPVPKPECNSESLSYLVQQGGTQWNKSPQFTQHTWPISNILSIWGPPCKWQLSPDPGQPIQDVVVVALLRACVCPVYRSRLDKSVVQGQQDNRGRLDDTCSSKKALWLRFRLRRNTLSHRLSRYKRLILSFALRDHHCLLSFWLVWLSFVAFSIGNFSVIRETERYLQSLVCLLLRLRSWRWGESSLHVCF